MHIAIAGNIGSGKTTLTAKLAKHYNWEPLYEDEEHNPYLKDFYDDMEKWAFHLQVYFLNSRFNQANHIRKSGISMIQDRTIYEDSHIFARNLHQSGLLDDRDYANYLSLFRSMTSFVQPPDLLIYLKADIPKLVSQIEKRGREYEESMRIDYLKNLNKLYEEWIASYKIGRLLIIDVNHKDFLHNTEDFSGVVGLVDREINGLFSNNR